MSADQSGTPARGYTWPPFEPGNEAALKHGARSERRWRPIADRLAAELLAERPWLEQHRRSVDAWARVEAQATLISNWLDEVGLLDDEGNPRPASDRLDRLESRAQSLRSDLAETPASMARLLSQLTTTAAQTGAVDALEALKSEGRALVARFEAATAEVTRESPAALPTAETDAQGPQTAPEPLLPGDVVDLTTTNTIRSDS